MHGAFVHSILGNNSGDWNTDEQCRHSLHWSMAGTEVLWPPDIGGAPTKLGIGPVRYCLKVTIRVSELSLTNISLHDGF